ncbi:B3 domain-containing protein At1g05920-like [Castanea sativa]|uniref:B3 domain-containing protein At1g05920-like n=1 Tax=Castanea sativa TaxID=21020 RepID=UPI003F65441D
MDKPNIVCEFRSKFLFKSTWGAYRRRSKPSLVYSQRWKDKAMGSPNKYHRYHKFEGLAVLAHVASLISIPNQSDSVLSKEKPPKPKRLRIKPRPRPRPRVTRRAGPHPPPCLPTQFKDKINGLNGQDLKLVIQKILSKTDMKPHFARLSIPKGQVRTDFLSQEDHTILEQREANEINYKGMEVPLIEPSLAKSTIVLKKWKLGCSKSYILSSGWQKVAVDNGLEADNIIQLWCFKVNQIVHLALVKL